jgi:iron complex outermembrane receptor protein
VKSTATDLAGEYRFDELPAGLYRISALDVGFERATREMVTVKAGEDARVDFVLSLARQQTVLTVTAPATSEEGLPARSRTSDAAALLEGTPGVSFYRGGGVSSLPVIHGFADDRVLVTVDGMALQSACSNHMNPPLSYADPSRVGRIDVLAGLTPVSRGGDSIGGSVVVDSPRPEFAKEGDRLVARASVSLYRRSNGGVNDRSVSLSAATQAFRVAYTGSYAAADDYESGAGTTIKSTSYESNNHAVQLATRRAKGLFTVDLGLQHIPHQAFVNARMDMTDNTARFANVRYENVFGWGSLEARGYYQYTRHSMNILDDKKPGMNMPMETKGSTSGYSVRAELPLPARGNLHLGGEFQHFGLDDWWPPVSAKVGSMGPDTLWNINNGRRNRFGTYAEWEARRGSSWTTVLGIRSDIVMMDTGNVTGYNMSETTTGSAAYYADATEFNSASHARTDYNIDVTALARFEPGGGGSVEFGYARKTRSPNLYERYLWVKRSNMSVQMNGWFGDANGYTGNLDLRPEAADTLSATIGWRNASRGQWELRVTPYYSRVHDYIDVDRCPVIPGSNGCTAAKLVATSGFVNLQFVNHEARQYGVDLSGRTPLGGNALLGRFSLSGVLGYVQGRNLDTDDNLYHMMPLHGTLRLEHDRARWATTLAVQVVSAMTNAQAVRVELSTPGYTLASLFSSYSWEHLRLEVGVDNLFNRSYVLPLGGRYWIGDKTGSTSVPGMGRSLIGGLTVKL